MNRNEEVIRAVEQARAEVDDEGTARLFADYARLLRALDEGRARVRLDAHRVAEAATPEKLNAGRPALAFHDLNLDHAAFGEWARRVRDLLAERDPGLAYETEELDDARAIELAEAFYDNGATGEGPAYDAVIGNALVPWLEEARAIVFPRLRLDRWHRTYCPVCAGNPDFATTEPGGEQRTLLCERCSAEWPVGTGFCVYCGEDDPASLGYYSSPDEAYRVEVCDRCRHYLKAVDRGVLPGALLAAERLITPGLDLIAVQEGYSRPSGWTEEDE